MRRRGAGSLVGGGAVVDQDDAGRSRIVGRINPTVMRIGGVEDQDLVWLRAHVGRIVVQRSDAQAAFEGEHEFAGRNEGLHGRMVVADDGDR